MEELRTLIKEGNAEETAGRIAALLESGVGPEAIMKEGIIAAMDEVGELFAAGEYFVPEMLIAAKAVKRGLEVLKPALVKSGMEPRGKVVMGSVKGDLHDIGKNLVIMTLEGAGFEVLDLGVDVPPAAFVDAVREHAPQVVGLSALLTTTMLSMKETIETLREAGLRDGVKVMIGGAPVTQEFADAIGADHYGPHATSAKDFALSVAGLKG